MASAEGEVLALRRTSQAAQYVAAARDTWHPRSCRCHRPDVACVCSRSEVELLRSDNDSLRAQVASTMQRLSQATTVELELREQLAASKAREAHAKVCCRSAVAAC